MADERVPQPTFQVTWRDVNVSAAIEPFMTQLQFTDNMHGEADELSITLEDSQGIFTGPSYFPKLGDDLALMIGYESGPLQGLWYCGTFAVDEIKAHGPPDQLTMRALSASVKSPLRQRGSKTWQKTKLKEVINATVKGAGMTMLGTLPDVTLARCTRDNETPMEFIIRMAEAFGCYVKVTDGEVVVNTISQMLNQEAQVTINRQDCRDYDLSQKITTTARDAVVRAWNPELKDKILHTAKPRPVIPVGKVPLPNSSARQAGGTQVAGPSAQDVAVIMGTVEDYAQAEIRRQARRMVAKMQSAEGTLRFYGDPRLRAAMPVQLNGFGVQSGPYVIVRAAHRFERGGGYDTTIDVMRKPE